MNKKSFFISCISLVVVIAFYYLFFARPQPNPYSSEYGQTPDTTHPQQNPYTYVNEKHHYSFEYDQALTIKNSQPDTVILSDPTSNMWVIQMEVRNSSTQSAEQWLRENKSQKREREITIGGSSGIVTHYVSDEGDVPDQKTAVFVKDGKLFVISSRSTDHDLVWRSWRFVQYRSAHSKPRQFPFSLAL